MRNYLKKKTEEILKNCAQRILKKFNPFIICVTGSFGKTSTKEAIKDVLSQKYDILANKDTYNTELGVPLTILEEEEPVYPVGWIFKLIKCYFKSLFLKSYHEKLVLEMGADKPGDIEYLMSFVKPDIAIVTNIGPVHLEEFESVESIFEEKLKLPKSLSKEGIAILNWDDDKVRMMNRHIDGRIMYFSKSEKTDIWAQDIKIENTDLFFKINYDDEKVKVHLKNNANPLAVYSVLVSFLIGKILNLKNEEIIKGIDKIKPFKGRMRIISGINESTIIDDSYNSNPETAKNALGVLAKFSTKGRKIAVLGKMNELGTYKEEGHKIVGKTVPGKADILVAVGEEPKKYIAHEAIKHGFSKDKIYFLENSKKAGDFLKTFIKKDDIILFKGSQNSVRLEWAIEKVMTDPSEAKNLLVRQGPKWRK